MIYLQIEESEGRGAFAERRMHMKQKQIYNPYMPTFEYVPDGEPHVFGDRIYLYGSHDRFGGVHFCLNDYICYSAPVTDLTDWRYEGVIYSKEQDPRNQNIPADAPPNKPGFLIEMGGEDCLNPPGIHAMWAPDVAQGPDGRFYLYYCLDFLNRIGVAVCDTPAGKYEFLGFVRHGDGMPLGDREGDLMQFDPGIFVDEDGEIYLYSGNAPMHREQSGEGQGSQVMTLCEDMLTLKTAPRHLMPNIHESAGTQTRREETIDVVDKVVDYIENHLSEELSVRQLANMAYVSPDHLTRSFKKRFQQTVSDYILKKRMTLAGELLRDRKLTITMVSDCVGFGNYSYFTEQFKKYYGMTPREYQNSVK